MYCGGEKKVDEVDVTVWMAVLGDGTNRQDSTKDRLWK